MAERNTSDSKVPVRAGNPIAKLRYTVTAARLAKAARRAQCDAGSLLPSLRKRKGA